MSRVKKTRFKKTRPEISEVTAIWPEALPAPQQQITTNFFKKLVSELVFVWLADWLIGWLAAKLAAVPAD